MNVKKIEDTHKENWRLIRKYCLRKGDKLQLLKDFRYKKKGDIFTISFIHSSYGWVLFEETEQLPQEVSELEKIFNLYNLKGGED